MALVDSEHTASAPPSAAAGLLARIKAKFAERSDSTAGAGRGRKSFSGAPRQRAAGARQPGAAGALDGQLRVRHLHLRVDLGADGRRALRRRPVVGGAALYSGIHRAQIARPPARVSDRQPLARLRRRHRYRRDWRHRRDGGRAAPRPVHRAAALPRLPRRSDLRPGAGASRHRAILQLAQPRADAVLHLAPARHHRLDGRGLSLWRADRCDDGDDDRRWRHLGGHYRPTGHARPPTRDDGAGRPKDLRTESVARHFAADLRVGSLLFAADLRRHSLARAIAFARRGGGLLCRRAAPGGRRLRLFRHRRRHHAQVHRISRVGRPKAAGLVLRRDHPLDVLAVAGRLRADPRARPAAARRCSAPASSAATA